MNRFASFIIALIIIALPGAPLSARGFIDYGPADKFIDIEFHGFVGGSMITENYLSCFPELSQMNTAPGVASGAGATAVCALRDWIGIGTGIDICFNNYRIDMAASSADLSSVSNIFLRNSASYLRFPVFIRFAFNVAPTVRWRVDGGIYYAYGVGGHQKQDIYNAQVNSLGQLVSASISDRYGYFNNRNSFIHSIHRSDIGLHAATSLLFRHFSVGATLDLGLKNVAFIYDNRGIVTPNVHNFTYGVVLGYTL